MSQQVVVDTGNIYACEALHKADISPLRSANQVSLVRLIEPEHMQITLNLKIYTIRYRTNIDH